MTDYLPVARRKAFDKRLAGIFANVDAEAGLRDARRLAAQLRKDHPDAVEFPADRGGFGLRGVRAD